MTRLEVAQDLAVVGAEFQENILDNVFDDGGRGFSPETGHTIDAEGDGAAEAADKFAPLLGASLHGAKASQVVRWELFNGHGICFRLHQRQGLQRAFQSIALKD
jgi:hypothetical protein